MDTDHADLAANIVPGYDFKDGDSDPRPTTSFDNHGTPVAGVAAAVVDNNQGIAGVAGKSKILPVRIARTVDAAGTLEFASATELYRAFIYAADNADVLNCSWKLATFSSTVWSGINYAYSYGRAGKGCAVLVAAGGDASGHGPLSWEGDVIGLDLTPLGTGTRSVEFSYEKDSAGSEGDDAVWLAEIYVPLLNSPFDFTVFTFDNGTFAGSGWTVGGNAGFTLNSSDPAHAHGTSGHALKSGTITHNQSSKLQSPLLDITSAKPAIFFRRWMSSAGSDVLRVYVKDQNGNVLGSATLGGGQVTDRSTAVAWPASLSTVLSVGTSTDFDFRASYSAFGSTLKFLAPAAGGFASENSAFWDIDGILTLDRTGSAGYVADDFTTIWGKTGGVGGTSMSSAIAAGVAALVLSKDGNQTRANVADRLIQNCDKVGPVAYSGSPLRNDYYGYGRLNALASVNATTADTTAPTYTSATVMHHRAVDVVFSEPMGDGTLTPGNYSITAGGGNLSQNPAKVIRITPSVYRLIWNAGDMATSGTVTIAASSSIKDVAGNALTGTLSRSSTGTKRIIGVNGGGSPNASSGHGSYYAPPFIADNGFQGNEANPLLTLTSPLSAHYWFSGTPDTSGVTDPAPNAVYQTARVEYYSTQDMIYSIPVDSGTYKLRLHFCENYVNTVGDQVFHIYVNGNLVWSNFDILAQTGGQQHKAYIAEFNNVSPVSGKITVMLDPQPTSVSGASISGIEIVKP